MVFLPLGNLEPLGSGKAKKEVKAKKECFFSHR